MIEIEQLRNEYNDLFIKYGILDKREKYYERALWCQKRLTTKVHVYKVEMERMRRKLERIYKAIYRDAYIKYELQSYLPIKSKQLTVEATEFANKKVEYFKSV